jgi:hypothetical protein
MSTTGDDNNTGEADSPVKSLKRALEIASVNGRGVFVKSGTYDLTQGFDGLIQTTSLFSYSYFAGGKPYQGNIEGNSSLLKSALYLQPPILGEFTLYRELSANDYTITRTIDNSYSYMTFQISPTPNFNTDELKGKILIVNYTSNIGYDNYNYYYRIIKNTGDTIYATGTTGGSGVLPGRVISIYDCPTLQIPSGKTIYFSSLGYSLIGLNFEVNGNFFIYGNISFYACHFLAPTTKYILMYSLQGKITPLLVHCLFNNVYAQGSGESNAYIYRNAFIGVPVAIKNISKVSSCSAWGCGDFYQLDSGTFLDRVNIQYAGGRDNTGNFININTSGYKSSNAEIAIQNSIYGDRFTIDVRDIQFANGYKTSLDAIPYSLLVSRKQAVKLVENEDGLRIWISG